MHNLTSFSNHLLAFHQLGKEVTDLNWARTIAWRHLFHDHFSSTQSLENLQNSSTIEIAYNAIEHPYFCKSIIKAIYISIWLGHCLDWTLQSVDMEEKKLTFSHQGKQVHLLLQPQEEQSFTTTAIVSIKVTTEADECLYMHRNANNPQEVMIESFSPSVCSLRSLSLLEKPQFGRSLISEIYFKGMSEHFLHVLQTLSLMNVSC